LQRHSTQQLAFQWHYVASSTHSSIARTQETGIGQG